MLVNLKEDFIIEYKNHVIQSQVLIGHKKKLSNTWMKDYQFNNLPLSSLIEDEEMTSFLHPVIHNIVYDEAGNFEVARISLLTIGSFLAVILSCFVCCWKCPGYGTWWLNKLKSFGTSLYECITTQTWRKKKENLKLKKEITQKKKQIRENLEDLQLVNEALGTKNLPDMRTDPTGDEGKILLNQKRVMWTRDGAGRTRRSSSLSSVVSS